MTQSIALTCWMAHPQPWTLVDKESAFREFETQPAYYQRWLEYRAGKGHSLIALARSVTLTQYLVQRKIGRQEDPKITLKDLCEYLWTSENDPFEALKSAVEYNNFAIAELIYNRLQPLTDERHYLLVNTTIDSGSPDALEMLLEGFNKIENASVRRAAKEGSDDIKEVMRRFVDLDMY
jgi:hypothetical protein